MIKWFLLQDDKVKGPFSGDEVKAKVADGVLSSNCLIWGRPQSSWQNISWWIKESSQLTMSHQSEVVEQKWHYAVEGVSKGPLSRVELVNDIKNLKNKGEILVWTKGMKAWADLYEFHDLLDEIGMNRREHPRSSITGSITVTYEDKTLIGVLKTISPGGLGAAQLNAQIPIGQQVTIAVKSELLNEPITVKAMTQYHSETGYYGFKFLGINMEAKAIILEYIKSYKPPVSQAA